MPSPSNIAYSVNLMSDLSGLTGGSNYETILLLGYHSLNDGGGGEFYWDSASVLTPDGGSVIQVTGVTTGRWIRVFYSSIINVKFWGAYGNGTNNDTTAIQAAINYPGRGVVEFPEGDYYVTNLYIPNNISLKGSGTGFASNKRTALLCHATSGICLEFKGYYIDVSGMLLVYSGSSENKDSVTAVAYNLTTGGVQITRTSLSKVTIQGFGVGITNNRNITSFTHYHEEVYVVECTIGLWFVKVNNLVFSKCFIESCGDGVILNSFVNVVFDSGCAFEIFGPDPSRPSERLDSKLFIASNGYSLTIRDFYSEVGTDLTAGQVPNSQQFAQFKKIRGLVISGGIFTRSGVEMLPMIQFMDNMSAGVEIKNNSIPKGASGTITYWVDGLDVTVDGGASRNNVYSMDINNNTLPTRLYERPKNFDLKLYRTSDDAQLDVTFSSVNTFCYSSGGLTTAYVEFTIATTGTLLDSSQLQIGVPVEMFDDIGPTELTRTAYITNGLVNTYSNTIASIENGANRIRLYRDYFAALLRPNDLKIGSYLLLEIQYPTKRQQSYPVTPALNDVTVTTITTTTAACSSEVISDGNLTVTDRGFCWATTTNPTLADSSISCGSGTGNFSGTLTGLTTATTYYVTAYATNSLGTDYGMQAVFTTL